MTRAVEAPNGLAALAQLLWYILRVSEHVQREALEALLLQQVGPHTREAIVTAGQLLVEEGRQQGRQGFQQVLLQLLRQRFGDQVDAVVERRVMEAPFERVQEWTMRVLSAATLGELFVN